MKQYKYLFSLLMAVVMMAMCPQRMWAGASTTPYEVSTIAELSNAINNGKTSIKVTANITDWTSLNISDKTLEIDFDGHTIAMDPTKTDPLFYLYTSTVTLKNLKVESGCYFAIFNSNDNNMTLSGCDINVEKYIFRSYSLGNNIYIDGGTTLSNNGNSSAFEYISSVKIAGPCTITHYASDPIFRNCGEVNIAGDYKVLGKDDSVIDLTENLTSWGFYETKKYYLNIVADATACEKGAHTMTFVGSSEPTCTAAGNGKYHCSTCNKDYSDAQGNWLSTNNTTLPALGHSYVEDAQNHKVTCSRTGCTFEAPMLTDGVNTGLTYAENSEYTGAYASSFTTMYYFRAPGTGTLTVTDSDGGIDNDQTYGALFNEDKSKCLTSNYLGNNNCFKFTYNVTEGEVYWIGARAYSFGDECYNHILTISGTWPRSVASATLTDREAYDGSMAYQQAATFTYKRTFTNNDWECLYVPFKADVADFTDCDIYTINMFQEHDSDDDGILDELTLEVNKVTSGKILANHPYLIKYKGELTAEEKNFGKKITFTMSDIYIEEAKTNGYTCSSMSRNYTFCGTYGHIDHVEVYYDGFYTIGSQNGKKVIGHFYVDINPQRWYMTMSARESQFNTSSSTSNLAKAIRIVCDEEEDDVTGISLTPALTRREGAGKFVENGQVVIVKNGKKYNINGQEVR